MRIEDFNERLRTAILVGDGAMGSLLYESVGPQRCVEELNSTHAGSCVSRSSDVSRSWRADHRDEHVWREPPQAGAARDGRARRRAESSRRENRARGPRSGEARSSDRWIDRPARNHSPHARHAGAKKLLRFSRSRPEHWKSAAWIFLFWKLSATSKSCRMRLMRSGRFREFPLLRR